MVGMQFRVGVGGKWFEPIVSRSRLAFAISWSACDGSSVEYFHAAQCTLHVFHRLRTVWRASSPAFAASTRANSAVTSRPLASNGGGGFRRCLFNNSCGRLRR